MNQIQDFSRKYSQAPWRKQSQIIGLVLVIVIFVTLFAAVYLHISARTAEVGRQIQVMQNEIDDLDRKIEDMRSKLAVIESSDEMQKRAAGLGFKPIVMEDITFLSVPGYVEPSAFDFQNYSEEPKASSTITPPEYTESLFDWMKRKVSIYMVMR
jgi:hypothetical protein